MAKLIVSRPRQFADRARAYRILIDGQSAASIGPGGHVEVPLPPGRHEIRARIDYCTSRPVEIEAGPEGSHHLRVGSKLRGPLAIIPLYPALAIAGNWLLSLAGDYRFGHDTARKLEIFFIHPIVFSSLAVLVALLALWRRDYLYLLEIPGSHPTPQQMADLERAQPLLPARLTIRGTMILIAAIAFGFWVSLELARSTQGSSFQSRARFHADLEERYRGFERRSITAASRMEKLGQDSGALRQAAAREAWRADYHAALRRKYEEAAARRALSVEPDPPAPPWP